MAGNTRGRIKEHFAGIHKNIDWIEYHCDKIVLLVDGKKSNLTEAVEFFHREMKVLDELAQSLYNTI